MEASSGVRCPVWFVALSVVVIAGCDVLVSFSIALFLASWDPCSVVFALVLLPVPAVLAVLQYCGTFRHNARAARATGTLLLAVGGLVLLAFVTMLTEMLLDYAFTNREWRILPVLPVGTAICLAGWLNLRWSGRLKLALPSAASAPAPARFSIRELLAAMTMIACTTGLVVHFVRSTLPRYAEDVARDQAPASLPANARHVSYCQGLRGTIAYEFTTDEEAFIAWIESDVGWREVQASGVAVRPIEGSFTISRYYALTAELQGPESITITNGLYYSWREEDRVVRAAFDRSTGRAYYYRQLH